MYPLGNQNKHILNLRTTFNQRRYDVVELILTIYTILLVQTQKNNVNLLTPDVEKWSQYTLQNCYCACCNFVTSDVKGVKNNMY